MKLLYKYELVFVLLLIVFGSLLRVVYLDRIPTGIGQDEIDYQLTARSLALSGEDISGTVDALGILMFHYPPSDSPKAELPYFIALSTELFSNVSLFSARLPYALISVATIVLVYLIAKYLFSREVGIIAGLLFAGNPWEIFIGRTSFEVVPATFFFLLLYYLLLRLNNWKILFTIPVIFLAFYAYIATKVILFPFLLLIVIYLYFVEKRKQNTFAYLVILLTTLSLTFFFILSIYSQPGARTSDFLTPLSANISEEVNLARKTSISNPLTMLFENKITVYGRVVLVKFIETISPQYLILYGDSFVSFWRHGLFYLIDGIFFTVGAGLFLQKERKKFLLFFSLILLSIIPHLLHKGVGNFTPHITLLFPFVIMIISYGIYYAYTNFPKQYKKFYLSIVIICYSISFLYFSHFYFFYYPIKSQGFDFSSRILSKYITLATQQGKTVEVLSSYPVDAYKKYLFYTSAVQSNTLDEINRAFQTKTYSLRGVTMGKCGDITKSDITIFNTFCKEAHGALQGISIADTSDSGERYKIFHDPICNKSPLPPFLSHFSLSSLNIESLSPDTLCKSFFTLRPQ